MPQTAAKQAKLAQAVTEALESLRESASRLEELAKPEEKRASAPPAPQPAKETAG
jgi:hypothetical protein